jgi:hypothetical protein
MATAIFEAFEQAKRDELSKEELTSILLENDVIVPANVKLLNGVEYLEPIRTVLEGTLHTIVFDSKESFEGSGIITDSAVITPAGGLLHVIPEGYGLAVNTTQGFFSLDTTILEALRKLHPKPVQ